MNKVPVIKKEHKLLLLFLGLFLCATLLGIASVFFTEYKALFRSGSGLLMVASVGVGIAAERISLAWFTLYALIYLNLDLPSLSFLQDFRILIWFVGNAGTVLLLIYEHNKSKPKINKS